MHGLSEVPSRSLLLSELDSLGKKPCLQHFIIGNAPVMSTDKSLGEGGKGYFVFVFFMLFVYLELGHIPCCDSLSLTMFHVCGKSGALFFHLFDCIVHCTKTNIGRLQTV